LPRTGYSGFRPRDRWRARQAAIAARRGAPRLGDGRRLLAASKTSDGSIAWDLRSGAVVSEIGIGTEFGTRFELARNGRIAVSWVHWGRDSPVLRVWDPRSGTCLRELRPPGRKFDDVQLSRDGTRALAAVGPKLVLWDVATGERIHVLGDQTRDAWSGDLSRDGRIGISGSGDGAVRVWNLAVGRLRHELYGGGNEASRLAISADGTTAISNVASEDGRLKVWDIGRGRELHTLEGYVDSAASLSIASDCSAAVSSGLDHTVRLWDLRTGRELARFTSDFTVSPVDLATPRQIVGLDDGGRLHLLEVRR
jgi:WD40 repeat protein